MCVLGVLKGKKGGFLGSEKKGRKISQTSQSAEYIRVRGGGGLGYKGWCIYSKYSLVSHISSYIYVT